NLLATERKTDKKKGGGGAASAPGALQLYLFLGLFIGGALLACGAAYWYKEAQLRELDTKIQVATRRQAELNEIKKKVEAFQAKEKLLKDQKDLIDKLKLQQADSVH